MAGRTLTGGAADADPRRLVPAPQRAHLRTGRWRIPGDVTLAPLGDGAAAELGPALEVLSGELVRLGGRPVRMDGGAADIRCVVGDGAAVEVTDASDEAYRLTVSTSGADVTARGTVGLYRGLTTLSQWLRLHAAGGTGGTEIGGVEIDDWPDLETRGLMLDISRNRVPTQAELFALVDLMAELKLNQLQLYIEHTFAYVGHGTVWRDASPLRPGELRQLFDYARRRRVELVPNQNSFGHFHRWLIHPPYRRLAECPDGVEHPFSPEPEPFSLCPVDPEVFELLDDLYGQLLPHAPGTLFNVGLDETLDLGLGRSRGACEARGAGRVYLEYLHRVHALAAKHGRRMLFWADVALAEPGLLPEFPRDATALVWGYEADHDFAEPLAKLRDAGLEAYVCPGTATWNSFTGRVDVARSNASRAALEGRGAAGYLLTDWGDHGHLQPPSVSWPAYVLGAAFAWNRGLAEAPDDLPLADLLDRHVLRDASGTAGRALIELGRAQDAAGVAARNGGPLFFAWMFAEKAVDERRGVGFTDAGLDAASTRAQDAVDAIHRSDISRPDVETIRDELAWAADAARLGAELARARLRTGEDEPLGALPVGERRRLRTRMDGLVERLPSVWRRRSRDGGLRGSIERFARPGRDLL
ncbi:MAG: family 20 glycosylhydrolase [Acidobacteriota bacterium]